MPFASMLKSEFWVVPFRSESENEMLAPASGSVAEKFAKAVPIGRFSFIVKVEFVSMSLGGELSLAVNEIAGAHAVLQN